MRCEDKWTGWVAFYGRTKQHGQLLAQWLWLSKTEFLAKKFGALVAVVETAVSFQGGVPFLEVY
jgi:hypothetical protein